MNIEIETKELTLRKVQLKDKEDLYEIRDEEHILI